MKGGPPLNLDALTKSILKQSLSPNPERFSFLQGEILYAPEFYLVAESGTSQSDWDSGNYSFFVDKNKTLIVFLSSAEAAAFASRQKCVLPSGEFPIVCKDNESFAQLVAGYEADQRISNIKIYARPPIHVSFVPSDFHKGEQPLIPAPQKVPDTAAPVVPPAPSTAVRVFRGVEEVRKALDTFEPNARRKMDPGRRYENIHTLLQTLAQQNEIDPADLDRALKIKAENYSRRFFISVTEIDPPIEIMKKYLTFFGLQEYLYLYKSDSKELQQFLGSHKFIDKFKLRTPQSANVERFKLTEIIRSSYENDDAYVYKVTLNSSRGNTVEMVVSNPLKPPLIVGREYQLLNRDGSVRDEDKQPQRTTDTLAMLSEEEMLAEVAKAENKSKRRTNSEKAPRSYEEQQKDEIIRYFRTKKGLDTRSATAKFRDLEAEPDILDEFYKYVTKKQFGNVDLFGFSARKLIKEMHMDPYEAYLSLVQLRTNPQETKQRLIYRERDPQYQKPPKGKGDQES